MIYSAILYLCLAAAPTSCDEQHEIRVTAGANPSSGFVLLQDEAQRWLGEHPEYMLHHIHFNKPGLPA